MSDPSGSRVTAPMKGTPEHFHLLWEEELNELQPVLETIRERRDQVLEDWMQLYALHFGPARGLSDFDFKRLFGGELEATLQALLEKDIGRFVEAIRATGTELAKSRVPFAELVVSMHLFEESATRSFPPDAGPHLYQVFDKLSHIRIIALAQSYFGAYSALAATQIAELEQQVNAVAPEDRSYFHGIVGGTEVMRRLYRRISAAANSRAMVLVVGETGTGKELIARALHECGPQGKGPFVALNCAALPRELIEAELFGYRRGAFSGANADYAGLFRSAEGGTLFLDEITEMAIETQSKLLRVLQEKAVRPVGATRELPVNVRVIASTNRDPEQACAEGRLRRDLYYRLNANTLNTPPLRERIADIELLVRHFIRLFNESSKRVPPVEGVEHEALEALLRHSWPGNVRELAGAIESAFTFGTSLLITRKDLPTSIVSPQRTMTHAGQSHLPVMSINEAERELIQRALHMVGGNKSRAAQILAVSRKQLYAKIAKYGIDPEQ
ncbi:MAG TPA: sigma-54 dependent transcriptional regulator [Candidatus Binataceae bacterium]|nr:sigma-54 dependent transcriptional regulator [Candidatus Binataceae bacterium]